MFNWSLSISSTTLKSVKSLSPSTSSSFNRTFLENIIRSPFYHSLTSLEKTKLWSKFYVDDEENVQKVLDVVSVDQKVITNPHANRRRRTVIVTRNNEEPFGFTLQTYLLKRKGDDVPSKVTYVDYVQLDSPAADAGIRAGDVIISINGHVVTAMSHKELIKLIGSYHQMRMIVIFENIRQRIELVARAIKLRKILNDKLYQLNLIDIEEQKILNRAYLRSLSTKKITYSLPNSLSSATASSISSVSSVPSNLSGITNDTNERNIIRIPTIISLTHRALIEISKYPLKKRTLKRSDYGISEDSKQSTNLQSDFEKLENHPNTEMEVQRIRCYESDLENVSSSSYDTGQTIDPLVRFDNSCDDNDDNNDDDNDDDNDDGDGDDDDGDDVDDDDDDDTGNDGSNSFTTTENADDNDIDKDCDNDIATSDNFVGISENDDNDKISVFDSIILPDNITTVAAESPISESMFNSIGLNHVIMLNDDVISGEDDDDSDKIRIIKL